MTNNEIIRQELLKLIDELKEQQNLHGKEANESIERMIRELEQIALYLMAHTPEEAMEYARQEYFAAVTAEALITPGIATVIQDVKEHIYLPYYKGNIGDETGTLVSSKTRFDLASITKLFTVLEALKLTEDGLFDVNMMLSEFYRSPFRDLHVTVADLLRFKYELVTPQRIDDPNLTAVKFFRNILRPAIGPNSHTYSDIPFIIAKMLMPRGIDFLS